MNKITTEQRTTDAELIREVSPETVDAQKQKLLLESETRDVHAEHLERGLEISDLKNKLEAVKISKEQLLQEIDQIKGVLAKREDGFLKRINEIYEKHRARKTLAGKESNYKVHEEESQNLQQALDELQKLHNTEREKLEQTVLEFLDLEETQLGAEAAVIAENKEYLESVRKARDLKTMCERENCLVTHTILTKGYRPGTSLKTAPTDNSPLDYDLAAMGGAKLAADIIMGLDIELSCSSIREDSEDSVWKGYGGLGGFIITEGSIRLAGDCDLATSIERETNRRIQVGSPRGTFTGDNIVRSEEDLHLAVAGKGREIKGNHNEFVVESGKIAAVFISLAEDSNNVIFSDGEIPEEYTDERLNKIEGTFQGIETYADLIEIAENNGLPIFALFRGKAFRLGPVVQRVIVEKDLFRTVNRLPFKEITLLNGEVPFAEIREGKLLSEEAREAAKARVPKEVFK